ncbi:MAG: hypothetical protein WCD37_00435 [Chloroflexia bacterium]
MANSVRGLDMSKNSRPLGSLMDQLNGRYHRRALLIFMVLVLAHWVEHLVQAFQVYVLGLDRPHAGGALGFLVPWLVSSEVLHYGYALAMLVGLFLLRPAFLGTSLVWWTIALVIQFWHHFEHLLLFGQAIFHANLFGKAVPTSIIQLFIPRMELHLFYNAVVFIPMIIAMFYHTRPSKNESQVPTCTCGTHKLEYRGV